MNIIDPTTLVGNCCFNGSLFAKFDGKVSNFVPKDVEHFETWCIYRCTPSLKECLKSDLRFTRLCIESAKADISTNVALTQCCPKEDPRVCCTDDRLLVTFSHVCNFRWFRNTHIEGVICDPTKPTFDKLSEVYFHDLNSRSSMQKNWTFFTDQNVIQILYNIMPLEIFSWKEDRCIPFFERSWQHPTKPHLRLRGGCPPVRVESFFYVFVHSIQYEMYCVKIDPKIYTVVAVSQEPLMPNRGNKQDIHFPCGVIYEEKHDRFHVSLGIDDVQLGIFSITRTELEKSLCSVDDPSQSQSHDGR
jgi:predicted GH43/DUF377 family glycosyl hydrolase